MNPMKAATTTMAILLCVQLSLAGCDQDPREAGDPAAPATRHAPIDPCELITREDAEQLLGEAMKAGERGEEPRVGMRLCLYNPVDEESTRFLQISLSQPELAPHAASAPATMFEGIRGAMDSQRLDLDDLGDAAFIATGGLYLLARDCLISIGSGNSSRPETQARLLAAADIALRRLKDLR